MHKNLVQRRIVPDLHQSMNKICIRDVGVQRRVRSVIPATTMKTCIRWMDICRGRPTKSSNYKKKSGASTVDGRAAKDIEEAPQEVIHHRTATTRIVAVMKIVVDVDRRSVEKTMIDQQGVRDDGHSRTGETTKIDDRTAEDGVEVPEEIRHREEAITMEIVINLVVHRGDVENVTIDHKGRDADGDLPALIPIVQMTVVSIEADDG